MPVSYGELEPSPELRPLFSSYWIFRADAPLPPGFEHSVPPDGAVSFVALRGRPALALGPRTEPLCPPVRPGQVLYGARLWPGAAGAVLGGDTAWLKNRVVPLSEVMPPAWTRAWSSALEDQPADEDAARRLDQVCRPLAGLAARLDRVVLQAAFALIESRGRTPVAALAAASGLSERQLRRRFVPAVGLTPKELARVRRLRSSLLDALARPQRRWAELAAACGYADQAHLVREYRRLSGLSPEAFREQLERIRHGRVAS